jgi:hypothetical protein
MFSCKKTLSLCAAVLSLSLAGSTSAQEKVEFKGTPQVKLDVCSGKVQVLTQKQTDKGIDMEVQITVVGCGDTCTGTLEYALAFTDSSKNELLWQMADGWDWRSAQAPFTLKLHQQAPPNAQLKEIRSMKLGRCSSSTVTRQ